MDIKVGSCPDSWGVWFPSDSRQTPWNRFLDEVAEAGFEWIELGPLGYLPSDRSVLKAELTSRGLKVSASFVMAPLEEASGLGRLQDEALKIGELLAELGAPYLVLIDDVYRDLLTGAALADSSLDQDSWGRLIEATNVVGRLVSEKLGLKLVFHPHADTHVELEGQVETLVAQTDPAYVGICLDFGHFEYRGGDSLAFLRRHADRIPYLHLKAVDPAIRSRVAADNPPFAEAVRWGVFTEPARGVPDAAALADVLADVDYSGWATVEQDMYPCAFDEPLPIARRTRQQLLAVGIG